ncbi:MAG: DUF3365 domain-containing protein [Candidatus Scalindua sp. AMX11]|nr:MAG: DUF3365 domain-containing protein [Candidatus Scalindua sp.]NOG83122.1 DUF3365 domain-containing protein [Planctomycetota bacterium]RZV75862.1 MAG: DUF3365 domain-containing protein [Candidatus Scalindua sp. SCAELEC01]TDE64921.1 MAG: DUF3365 domain-containing protein [Candidatus Scalindua sp. AMX11]GJQ60232.1 MAG: hypothetical protein SCALA701_30330 [Candidatus Scalindua sp.]
MKDKFYIVNLFIILVLLLTSDTVVAKKRWQDSFIKPKEVAAEKSAVKAIARARLALEEADILHQAYITLIAENFTTGPGVLNAVDITEKVFEIVEKKGKYKARILSTAEKPLLSKYAPRDDFEVYAIKIILSGKSYYERVFFDYDGKDFLRASTPVSVTTKKCLVCHPTKKVGDIMGIISYTFPLEEYYK